MYMKMYDQSKHVLSVFLCLCQVTRSIDEDAPLVLWLWPVGVILIRGAPTQHKQALRQIIFTFIPSSLSTPLPLIQFRSIEWNIW